MRTELIIEGKEYRLTLYPQTKEEKAILALFAEREDITSEMSVTRSRPHPYPFDQDPEVNHFTLFFNQKPPIRDGSPSEADLDGPAKELGRSIQELSE